MFYFSLTIELSNTTILYNYGDAVIFSNSATLFDIYEWLSMVSLLQHLTILGSH